jgi:hypothetical protein
MIYYKVFLPPTHTHTISLPSPSPLPPLPFPSFHPLSLLNFSLATHISLQKNEYCKHIQTLISLQRHFDIKLLSILPSLLSLPVLVLARMKERERKKKTSTHPSLQNPNSRPRPLQAKPESKIWFRFRFFQCMLTKLSNAMQCKSNTPRKTRGLPFKYRKRKIIIFQYSIKWMQQVTY